MTNTNVLMMGNYKELKEARRSQDNYRRYLGTLANSQLETEISYLLDEFSMDNYGSDFSSKVKLIQNEIIARADQDWKLRIENLTKESQIHL
jgi:hypothetical protein